MQKYEVDNIKNLSPSTILLTIKRKQKGSLSFVPGQYAAISFQKNGRPTPVRFFSIVNSPGSGEALQFAMRVKGNYTRTVSELNKGDTVYVRGPYGEFIIDPEFDKRIIMMAGGIGVTPFVSMIRHATETRSQISMTLLYSCKTEDDIPFINELRLLEQRNPQFKLVLFISSGEINGINKSTVVRGRIRSGMVEQISGGSTNKYTFFVCGPSSFIGNMSDMLVGMGTEPQRIVVEAFGPGLSISKNDSKSSLQMLIYSLSGVAMVAAFASILVLDVVHNAAKISAQAPSSATTSTQSTTPTTVTQTTSTPQDTTTTQPPVNQTPTVTPTTQDYQQPVSSVS